VFDVAAGVADGEADDGGASAAAIASPAVKVSSSDGGEDSEAAHTDCPKDSRKH
jgi:hypothetical protein